MRSRKTAIEWGIERANDAPCFECKRRAVGCHSACVDYNGYKKQVSDARRDAVQRNIGLMAADWYKIEKVRKNKKRERK